MCLGYLLVNPCVLSYLFLCVLEMCPSVRRDCTGRVAIGQLNNSCLGAQDVKAKGVCPCFSGQCYVGAVFQKKPCSGPSVRLIRLDWKASHNNTLLCQGRKKDGSLDKRCCSKTAQFSSVCVHITCASVRLIRLDWIQW